MTYSLDKPTLTPTPIPIPVPPLTPIPTRHTQKSTNIKQISTIVCQQKGGESLKNWDGQSRSVPLSDPTKLLRPR